MYNLKICNYENMKELQNETPDGVQTFWGRMA